MIQPSTIALCCLSSLVFSGIAVAQPTRATGKFYIVGMGTAPDLITVRAQRVIAKADIVITEEGSEGGWTDLVRGKELWSWPHTFRRYYGIDPKTLKEPSQRAQAEAMARTRQQLTEKIRMAVEQGKTVACLQAGDPMMYGMTLFLEMLPADLPSEIVPGVGAFQAASAAVKMSPPYGYDTDRKSVV